MGRTTDARGGPLALVGIDKLVPSGGGRGGLMAARGGGCTLGQGSQQHGQEGHQGGGHCDMMREN